jgi:hypothetical protein
MVIVFPYLGKAFFSEEKKQKTFMSLSRFYPERTPQEAEVFWFFFSKKNCFLSSSSKHAKAD